MTTLYRPALIESDEQADALPAGTVIECTSGPLLGVAPHRKTVAGTWFGGSGHRQTEDLRIVASQELRCEWTALVPLEAEEGWTPMVAGHAYVNGKKSETHVRDIVSTWPGAVTARRLATPWEEA